MTALASLSGRTVAVTGASGFLGRHLVRNLLDEGCRVRCLTRSGALPRGLESSGALPFRFFLEDKALMREALKGAEIVIHTAADHVRRMSGKRELLKTNVEGTGNLLETMDEGAAFLLVSSIRSMMTRARREIDETVRYDFAGDDTPYGLSKHLAEELCLDWHKKTGSPLYILNPAVIFGPEDFGPSHNGRLILAHLKRRAALAADAMISFVDVRDAARAALFILTRGRPGERHIASSASMSMRELFALVDRAQGTSKVCLTLPNPLLWTAGLCFECLELAFPGLDPPVVRSSVTVARLGTTFSGDKLRRMGFHYTDPAVTIRDTVAWFCENSL